MPDEAVKDPESTLAREIRRRRDRQGLTAQRLAELVTAEGGKLTRQAISKIENGDRAVSISELLLLARALRVPPILLIFPVGVEETTEFVPGKVIGTWPAARWFSGEATWDDAAPDAVTNAVPIRLYRQHQQQLDGYFGALAMIDLIEVAPGSAGETQLKEAAQKALQELRRTRGEIRRHGLAPPALTEDLKYIDGYTDAMTLLEDSVRGAPGFDQPTTTDDKEGDE